MKNELMIFEGKSVEVLNFRGKVLFNPKDVAACLGIKNINDNIRFMNMNQVVKLTNSIIGDADFRRLHNTGENFLTESGVYKLIFKSRKPEAERFQDWVTDIVLPQIRQTGGYIPVEEKMTNEEFLAKAFLIAQKTLEKKDEIIQSQKNIIKEKEEVIDELIPKAESWTKFLDSDGLTTIDHFSKSLAIKGFGRNNMYKWLRYKKYLQMDNMPYARYVNQSQLFQVKNAGYHFEGTRMVEDKKTFLTAKGVEYFINQFKKEGII